MAVTALRRHWIRCLRPLVCHVWCFSLAHWTTSSTVLSNQRKHSIQMWFESVPLTDLFLFKPLYGNSSTTILPMHTEWSWMFEWPLKPSLSMIRMILSRCFVTHLHNPNTVRIIQTSNESDGFMNCNGYCNYWAYRIACWTFICAKFDFAVLAFVLMLVKHAIQYLSNQ